MPDGLHTRLKEISETTGLTQAEIARRGILDQVKELEGESL
ncbi:hypothetical protein HRED_03799 [Candidatus Haloredivivus sp. G17]|nr:hypothetical protein HRED_00803 [Candidatus Haloredivivus sp. G17]EHK02637.1 hypothetical protein HRED_03799 [Candidatus Haloredivivus sp. G17]